MKEKTFKTQTVSKTMFDFLEAHNVDNIQSEALKIDWDSSFFMKNLGEIDRLFKAVFNGEDISRLKKTHVLVFLKITGLYELEKDPEYYIHLPDFEDLTESYINYDPKADTLFLSDNQELGRFKTKFTMKDIEQNETLSAYKEFAEKVVE